MSSGLTTPDPQEPTLDLPTRAQMDAKIAADRFLAPAARKAREDALRAHIDAEIAAARCDGVRGLAPAARLGLGGLGGSDATDAGSEPGEDDGPGISDFLNEPAPPLSPRPFQGPYKRARDLAGTVFPVSEAVILAAARKAGIGRRVGRTIVFSPDDTHRLYKEAFQPCSNSSVAANRPIGSRAALSGAAAMKKAHKLLTTAAPAKGAPRNGGRSARPKSSSKRSTVVAFQKPLREPS
jgi:hypothetical protein